MWKNPLPAARHHPEYFSSPGKDIKIAS